MTAFADIDVGAITANAKALAKDACVPLCAVVKANGYGHGLADVAKAAVAGGATWLAVATLSEAVEAFEAFEDAAAVRELPVLVLSEQPAARFAELNSPLPASARFTVGSVAGVAALAALKTSVKVHLKVDTGMHRVGVAPSDVVAVADAVVAAKHELEGVWTHLADADSDDLSFTTAQLGSFEAVLADLEKSGHFPSVKHAANSAAAIAVPKARFDMVRVGIALYGVAPSDHLETALAALKLQPAMRLHSAVTAVREVAAGETVSYGRRWTATNDTRIATVPIGYADGVRRDSGTRDDRSGKNVEVLIGGKHWPIVGNVTMDQLMVAVDDSVEIGDEVVLIGKQGGAHITVNETAKKLGTIGYEVLTGIGPRVVRTTV